MSNLLIAPSELPPYAPQSDKHRRRLEAQGLFPKRVRISERRHAYVADEINRWIEQKMLAGLAARDALAAA
jgi:hypothetical protein